MTPAETLRAFNRTLTTRIGALDGSYLGTGRALGPSRVLFELDGPTPVASLRDRLGLDSGYLSRLLRDLEADGLVGVGPDPADGRRRVVSATAAGATQRARLEDASAARAAALLEPLGARQRERLAEALGVADRLLRAATVTFTPADPGEPGARRALDAYVAEIDARFPGGYGGGAPPAFTHFLVARDEGRAIGCGGLQPIPDGRIEVKRMWVHDDWRGTGVGGRLLRALEDAAAALGHDEVVLDTNPALVEAVALYERAGYTRIERYNDNPYAGLFFAKRVTR